MVGGRKYAFDTHYFVKLSNDLGSEIGSVVQKEVLGASMTEDNAFCNEICC